MLVLFQGSLGQGKTLGMSIWSWYLSLKSGGVPIYGNYGLRESYFKQHKKLNPNWHFSDVNDTVDLLKMCKKSPALFMVDEQHINMDSRLHSNQKNIYMTQFFMYLRKLGITMLMTSQSINQVDKRLRNILDVLIDCKKNKLGFYYTIWDYQYLRELKRMVLPYDKAQMFYDIYNTSKIVRPIQFPSTEKEFAGFLSNVEVINNKKWIERNL